MCTAEGGFEEGGIVSTNQVGRATSNANNLIPCSIGKGRGERRGDIPSINNLDNNDLWVHFDYSMRSSSALGKESNNFDVLPL